MVSVRGVVAAHRGKLVGSQRQSRSALKARQDATRL
jgi:hypothetical protein